MAISHARRTWRYEDLLTLPDDGRRYEIIDGELFEMPAASWNHAVTISNLMFLLGAMVRVLGGKIVTAPVDLFVAGANPVQPDIIVLLAERLGYATTRGVEGPPNLLIEIVSPSNPGHDRITKRALYARAGVPEYWLVDPETATIEVLILEGDQYRPLLHAIGDALVTSSQLPSLSFPAIEAFA
jgi:Uma2 family endonuclease